MINVKLATVLCKHNFLALKNIKIFLSAKKIALLISVLLYMKNSYKNHLRIFWNWTMLLIAI